MGVPIFGICCGQQVMMHDLGGKVEARLSHTVEHGRAYIAPDADRLPLLDGWFLDGTGRKRVWMSDGDHISALAPGFQVFTTSPGAPFCHHRRSCAQVLCRSFPPRIAHHTPNGETLYENLVRLAGFDAVTAPRRHRCAMVGSQQSKLGGSHVGDYHGRTGPGEQCVPGPRR